MGPECRGPAKGWELWGQSISAVSRKTLGETVRRMDWKAARPNAQNLDGQNDLT